jgi:CelD/BcsL family acetyltransferase involved in cellulose biosynthesis
MNFFSHETYLSTLAEVYFPAQDWTVETVEAGGHFFRCLVIGGTQVISTWQFLDFFSPVDRPPAGGVRQVPYLPRVVRAVTPSEEISVMSPQRRPSPYVDWTLFPQWDDFEALVKERIGNLFPDSRRKRRKLERDLGEISFQFDDHRPEVFESCIRWKSAQYVATSGVDQLANPLHVQMFKKLHERGAIVCSSFSAGDTLLAVHLGGMVQNRHYWWLPTYDPEYARYSPGRLMLEAILEESYRQGHAEFDFLVGDEPYKWHYATHNREIGEIGAPPLGLHLRRSTRQMVQRTLTRYPRLRQVATTVRGHLGL